MKSAETYAGIDQRPSEASESATTTYFASSADKPQSSVNVNMDVNTLNVETRVIAAQVGPYASPAPGQRGSLTGTDLGSAFVHRDQIWVMFGDSWYIDPYNVASLPDDALGHISLRDFPDGASVDAFVQAHPAPAGEPRWRAAGPTMPVVLSRGPRSGFAPVIVTHEGGMAPGGIGNVPMVGFSNGRDDEREGIFGVFFTYETVACESGRCDDGYECDAELGTSTLELLNPPCVVGSKSSCRANGRGFCQDPGTSIFDRRSEFGRLQSVVMVHQVGVTTPDDPVHFKAQPWATQRFMNTTGRTVSDFDAMRPGGVGNDYLPARGNALPRAGVFLWGRPNFGGIGALGLDAQLYLLWLPMPAPDADMHFEWKPQYFSGLDSQGRPQFSPRELDARPLDLDREQAGEQPEEPRDIVGQMGISWVPSLKHFVMFYGGGKAPMFSKGVFRGDADKVQHEPEGSLFVRFAENPWGPWTAPRKFLAAGHWQSDAEPIEQYAPGGILAHNNCRQRDCARYDPAYLLAVDTNNNGVMYGSNIIDVWTSEREGAADLYWFMSTWNPYQVVLMKTTFSY